ncbi:GAF domain-containing protein [Halobaculum sp. MBLA0143]|uniref:GAF domain-containing protein n=1 Tax=Halobaculum sp. MBLA0143 TaxID=3079933 RepID=UPI003523B2C7
MNSRQERVQVLYEISLAVGRGDGLEETAREGLSAYLRKLNCAAGAVLADDDAGEHEPVASVPARPTLNEGYRAAVDWLREHDETPPLPEMLSVGESTRVYLLELPGFGVLVLVKRGNRIGENTVGALGALNRKLADACRAEQVERELRGQRDRFEAVVETVPEPMVNVVTHDGESVVRDVNSAFEATFGCDREEAVGESLAALFDAPTDDRHSAETSVLDGGPATELAADRPTLGPDGVDTAWVNSETPVKREVVRPTPDGQRVFRLRTVPVPATEADHEQFGLYVDITEQRERQRTLERLYRAVRSFFDAESREAVCRRAVQAAADVLDFSTCGVHLYDRGTEGLVPMASVGTSEALDDGPPTYTDHETVVWQVYREREPVVVSDTATFDGRLPDTTTARSGLILPLGRHGVFIASATVRGAFDEADQYFGKLLARTLQTALDRTTREQSLREVQAATRSLVTAESAAAVAERLVGRVAETTSGPYTTVWRHDPTESQLTPVAWTDATEAVLGDGEVPTFEAGDSIAWEVFESGEARRVDSVSGNEAAYDPGSVMQSEVIVPLGEYGVLASGSRLPGDFSNEEFEILQTLAASAESALQIVRKQRELDVLDGVLARILRHNIRNDLNVVRGRAEMIVERGPAECAQHAERIVDTAQQVLSTAEHAKEIREVVNRRDERAQASLREIVDAATTAVDAPDGEVHVGELPAATVSVHPHFDAAVRHAVENGIEHTDTETPRVEVTAQTDDDRTVIEISDDGPGIPEAEVEPLRAGEETRLVHGSGAGLWIVDRVIRYSGGTVAFDTTGEGTTVRIVL